MSTTRYHAMKKVSITNAKIHVNFIRKLADGNYGTPEKDDFTVSNPVAFIKGFNTENCRVLDWSVIGSAKQSYKVEKEEYEAWIRTHGKPCSDDEEDDTVEQG